MVLMSIGETDPDPRPLTVDDLEHMPDDGRRYELVEGRLDVSPAPTYDHTVVNDRLHVTLALQAPKGLIVSTAPGINFNADRTHHRIPDLVVIPRTDRKPHCLTQAPLLAVEIVSQSSTFRDHHTKRNEYAKFGIASYWIIDPNPENPGLIELRLEEGQYREGSQAFGHDLFTTDAPFPLSLVPYWLQVDSDDWRERIDGSDAAGES